MFSFDLNQIPFAPHGQSRSINAENPRGEKGRGGQPLGYRAQGQALPQ